MITHKVNPIITTYVCVHIHTCTFKHKREGVKGLRTKTNLTFDPPTVNT